MDTTSLFQFPSAHFERTIQLGSLVSNDEWDYARDAMIDELSEELYPEHRDRAIEELTQECLQRFYLANPNVVSGSISLLEEARALMPAHSAAALVFAFASTETLVKLALIRPIVAGLVHTDCLADILSNFLLGRLTNLERLAPLLFGIVLEHANIDLRVFKRTGSNATLWDELLETQRIRNGTIHKGDFASAEQSTMALALAEFVANEIFIRVLSSLSLHLHGVSICPRPGRRICADQPLPSLPEVPPKPSATLSELRECFTEQEVDTYILREATLEIDSDTLLIRSRSPKYLVDKISELQRVTSNLYRRPIIVKLVSFD